MDIFHSKLAVLVTGASRSIGAAFALRFAELVDNASAGGSLLVVTSRSAAGLSDVRDAVRARNGRLRCAAVQMDLARPDKQTYGRHLFASVDASEQFDSALVVHNAAQLGHMATRVDGMDEVALLQDQFTVNVASMLLVNTLFWRRFAAARRKRVVNMSAPSAFHARPSFALTSMVKSGRKIVLNTLAAERADIKVLHFDPVAVDSPSLRHIRDASHSGDMRAKIAGLYAAGQVLGADAVARALSDRLASDAFDSGDTYTALGDKKVYVENVEAAS